MNNEKMLALLESIKKSHDAAGVVGYQNYIDLVKAIDELRGDIRNAAAKSSGKADLFKAATDVIKAAKKNKAWNRQLAGATVLNGKTYVCDSYRVMRIDSDLVNLERIPDDVLPLEYEKMFSGFRLDYMESVAELPTAAELKAGIKLAKARPEYYRGSHLAVMVGDAAYNPNYVLNAILAGGTTAKKEVGQNKPLCICGDGMETILLPIHLRESIPAGEIAILRG